METKKAALKSIGDILGDGKVHFHDDVERVKFASLLALPIVVQEFQLMEDWDGEFGTGDFAIIYFQDETTGTWYTTSCGGKAVINQLLKLRAKRALPIRCKVAQVAGNSGNNYYSLRNPE